MRIIGLLYLTSQLVNSAAVDPSSGCSRTQSYGSWTSNVAFEGESYTHAYTYPAGASNKNPAPLILFFHGWGGSSSECGNTCNLATQRGYATIALTGIGGKNGDWNSWNGFGSTASSLGVADAPDQALTVGDEYCGDERENDRTCNVDAYEVACYKDCNGNCADNCWWTTCKDSVEQTVSVLEDFLEHHCVDMERIYAVGWSNGGMFTYELAADPRTARYLAAISPQIGLPHYGYNRGPHPDHKIHHFGLWGNNDATVPPKEGASSLGCNVPCRTSESSGWFYTSSQCTMEKWAVDMGLSSDDTVTNNYGIPSYNRLIECSGFTGEESDAVVLGCIFNGGHFTTTYHDIVMLNFFDAHVKVVTSETKAPTSASPSSPSPTAEPETDAPITLSPVSPAPITGSPISANPISSSPTRVMTSPPTNRPTRSKTNKAAKVV